MEFNLFTPITVSFNDKNKEPINLHPKDQNVSH